jgi:hypothetical protein
MERTSADGHATELSAGNKSAGPNPAAAAEQQIIYRQPQNSVEQQVRQVDANKAKQDKPLANQSIPLIAVIPLLSDAAKNERNDKLKNLLEEQRSKKQKETENQKTAKRTLAEQIMYQNIRNRQRKHEQLSEEELELMRLLGAKEEIGTEELEHMHKDEAKTQEGEDGKN